MLAPAGYVAQRADHIGEPGLVTSQVIERVISADLVVADLTDHNANVYYELSLRHALKKPLIQMIDGNHACACAPPPPHQAAQLPPAYARENRCSQTR